MKYIVQPVFLNQFIGQIEELNPSKMFYGPRDIWGMAKSKMTKEELLKTLRQYYNYWMEESGEETTFCIKLEYSDAYSVEMINDQIDNFNPLKSVKEWSN